MAYDGCIRTADMRSLIAQVNASQPDVVIFDIEGWSDWELWQTNIGSSANAMKRRRADESLATLARRVVQVSLRRLSSAAGRKKGGEKSYD